MSFIDTNFNTNCDIDDIFTACENESQEMDIDLLTRPDGSRRPRPVTFTFTATDITLAKSYFQKSGHNIMLMKVIDVTPLVQTKVYYVFHRGRYFIVVTRNGEIIQCVHY